MNKEKILEEVNRCLNCKNPKCREACPLHNDIPQMISKLKEGNLQEAYEIDIKANPLGSICGLICPHEKLCQSACVRGIKETPVMIGAIEHYICNEAQNTAINLAQDESLITNHKVAIIGGGPARNCLCILPFEK